MQCPGHAESIAQMYNEIMSLPNNSGEIALRDPIESLYILLGKCNDNVPFEDMVAIWKISAKYITKVYREVIKNRRALKEK